LPPQSTAGTTSVTLVSLLVTAALGSWRLQDVQQLARHTPPAGPGDGERG
jgi:hypothetical protein